MLAHQRDVRRLGGGEGERAQVLGLEVVQLRLAGAARHHRGLAAARLEDVDHGATPDPRSCWPRAFYDFRHVGIGGRIRQCCCSLCLGLIPRSADNDP